jgi:hypothetical protein
MTKVPRRASWARRLRQIVPTSAGHLNVPPRPILPDRYILHAVTAECDWFHANFPKALMRSKQIAGVLGVVTVILMMLPVQVSAVDVAPLALNDQTKGSVPTAKEDEGSWYMRAWQKVRESFGGSKSGKATWVDKDLSGGGTCGSRGCACCHSPIMVPGNIDRTYVHPNTSGSKEDINALYLRSAKAISQMNATERDAFRRKIRRAIADGDTSSARAFIDASVAKPPARSN